ncbi:MULTISPECIES: ribosome hibernation-promoting factor, HPF/YfiA family [unclassified Pseudactinotalea]|uniref:ribosome hibernation-promoting factor, HPF/YfiA family n=1 Tax=unclassified Pseudactinotalea TaxID=2649176 RepID=UPI00128D7220|nr:MULTISPECIES: ribosome-associated translation inhibitor RaiA [unclassified Pseudactinotalea]MPV48879.1 ribosome-associated translation inhibitor RaiA [Pseudactinotalea sp. HY160]QGH68857.1 ribosome-associated translation inhibitor RaiA [Pseudactinotalea sp. HY158]
MEIVVVGRHTEVADRFRRHVEDKLGKVGQYSPYAQRVDVEVSHERNPRLVERSERIELTVRAKGPVVRAEASATDRYAALDLATAKLYERLRRARDRRKSHHTRGQFPDHVVPNELLPTPEPEPVEPDGLVAPTEPGIAVESQLGDSPVLVRQKVHETTPMSVDQALAEMEYVGHPFYLFIDAETHQPCVVYHRHGWTYGVIRLAVEVTAPEPATV